MVDNDEVEVPDGLVLTKWCTDRLVVIQQCRYQFLGVQVCLSHQNIDQSRCRVGHKNAAVFVENIGVALSLQHVKRFRPFLALNPIRKDIVMVINCRSEEEQLLLSTMAADNVVDRLLVHVWLVFAHELLKLGSDAAQLIPDFFCTRTLGQLGSGGYVIIKRVQLGHKHLYQPARDHDSLHRR